MKKTKIAILHQDLEWTEKEFERLLQKKQIDYKLFDIRKTSLSDITSFGENSDLKVLNRVYASVGNRDYSSLETTLNLLFDLEKKGILTINSYSGTKTDYFKNYAYSLMKKFDILTPTTLTYNGSDLDSVIDELNGLPLIVKRNSGGRAFNLAKCDSKLEVESAINTIRSSEDYSGDVIIQEFLEPIESRDYRVCVFDGEILYHHGRSLISLKDSEKPWLASRSQGSTILPIEKNIDSELASFAIKAASSVNVLLDIIDITKTEKGYCVIEHNPTPNFRPEYEGILGYSPVERILDGILKK